MNSLWVFGGVACFWLTMNFLLWRSETRGNVSSQVPLEGVVQRLLEAADSSVLTIRHRGQNIGQLRWTPSVLQDPSSTNNQWIDDTIVIGRTGYALDLDFSLSSGVEDGLGLGRMRGNGRLELSEDLTWRYFEFRVTQKSLEYSLTGNAVDGSLRVRLDQAHTPVFDENFPLNDPAQWVSRMDGLLGGYGLVTPGLLTGLSWMGVDIRGGTNVAVQQKTIPSNIARYEARTVHFRVGGQRVRAYEVVGTWLNRHEGRVWVGRGGEILHAKFPGEFELQDIRLPEERAAMGTTIR